MARISYHDSVNFLQERNYSARSPFARLEWFALLEESGASPLIAVIEADNTFAALPLMRTGNSLCSLSNWYSFTWKPMMSDPACSGAALTALARSLKQRTHRIILSLVPGENGIADDLSTAFKDAGWIVDMQVHDQNHVLDVSGRTFAEYWAARPGRMRTTLKRKARKVEVEISNNFDEDRWTDYQTIYAASWKPAEGDQALLRRFAAIEGRAGRLRMGIARHEGMAVAAQFWTIENGTAHIHKLAHLEEYRSFSAGTTLTAAMFEHAIDTDGVSLIDFGTGDDPYKADWMERVRPRYQLDCLDWAQPRAWPVLAKRGFDGFRRRLASSLPQG